MRSTDIEAVRAFLGCPTPEGWIAAALEQPALLLTDHANCEKKAAGTAAGFGTIVSARSGETEDVTICHLAVGWDAGQFKVGSITRGERTAKWNEMLRIEEALGAGATFAGLAALPIRRPVRTHGKPPG